MLSHEEIREKVQLIAQAYPVKKVSYFGSYARGKQTAKSDLDILAEFTTAGVSLIMLSEFKNRLEDELKIPVDVIPYPLPKNALIEIEEAIPVYGE